MGSACMFPCAIEVVHGCDGYAKALALCRQRLLMSVAYTWARDFA